MTNRTIKKDCEMLKNFESLRAGVEDSFLGKLKDIFTDNLLSVTLYGSYLSESFKKGISDINILIIINSSNIEQISQFGIKASKTIKKFNITPLILTKSEFNSSADVFPMEYFDIREQNRVIFGKDPTKPLKLTKKNLRHQLEERLRGNVASLRQLIVASSGKDKILTSFLKRGSGTSIALFRGLFRLKDITPVPSSSDEILNMVRESFGIDIEPFNLLMRLRKGERIESKTIAKGILSSLEDLIRIIDKMTFQD